MPQKIDMAYAIGLTPEKAVEYFRSKGHKITFRWPDLWQQAHAKAFTVAKCARLDILQDIRNAVDKSLSVGETLAQFQDNLEPMLKAKGWWGKHFMTDPLTGKSKAVQLGSPWRLATIYRTNLATAYVSSDWQAAWENREDRPYGQWHSVHDSHTRPSHMALDGKIFPLTDPFWKTHVPGHLGFGCRCYMTTLSEAEVRRRGLKVESSAGCMSEREVLVSKATGEVEKVSVYTDPQTGAKVATDPGWSYNPAMAAWQPDLDAYDYKIARDYVEGCVTGPHFALFFEGQSPCNFPVAVLGENFRSILGAKSQTVLLSDATLLKNKTHHPELGIADYQCLQTVIEKAQLIVRDGGQTLVFIKRGENIYQAALKVTGSGNRLFLSSLRLSSLTDAKRMRRRGEVLRDDLGQ